MTTNQDPFRSFATRAARTHYGVGKAHRPLSEPIVRATTYEVSSAAEHRALYQSRSELFYVRFGNPTVRAAGDLVARLEGAEAGLVFSSGMGAISTALLSLLRAGDHVVAQRRIFAQTSVFLDQTARALGVENPFVDHPDGARVAAAISARTRVVYVETPSNPELDVADLAEIAAVARRAGAKLLVDSTFASPCLQQPLALGASLVLHSGTKYLGGHSDVMGDAPAGSAALIHRLRQTQILLGTVLDPEAAWLLMRGMKTLAVRVTRQSQTALQIAELLENAPGVLSVRYPWLATSPGQEVARRQMRGGGGGVSFEVAGGCEGARAFLDGLEEISIATSLGGVETVIEIPADLDFEKENESQDTVSPALIRLAVGLEDPQDLIADLERGLKSVERVAATKVESL